MKNYDQPNTPLSLMDSATNMSWASQSKPISLKTRPICRKEIKIKIKRNFHLKIYQEHEEQARKLKIHVDFDQILSNKRHKSIEYGILKHNDASNENKQTIITLFKHNNI